MEQTIDLTKGGVAIVLVGNTGHVQEFANNPAVKFIDCKTIEASQLTAQFPTNTKAVIMTDGIGNGHATWAQSWCRGKQVLWVVRKSNQAIYETLKGFFPNGTAKQVVTQEEAQETAAKGRLSLLIPDIDWNKSNAENARDLLKIATEKGIKTTLGSLAQFCANKRRESGRSEVPKSTRSKLDVSVEMLDQAIQGLTDMREFLIATVEENRVLKAKVTKMKELFGD